MPNLQISNTEKDETMSSQGYNLKDIKLRNAKLTDATLTVYELSGKSIITATVSHANLVESSFKIDGTGNITGILQSKLPEGISSQDYEVVPIQLDGGILDCLLSDRELIEYKINGHPLEGVNVKDTTITGGVLDGAEGDFQMLPEENRLRPPSE